MIRFDSTSRYISIMSDSTATTDEPTYTILYDDGYVDGTFVAQEITGSLTGVTPVTVFQGAASPYRFLKYLNVENIDTVNHTVSVFLVDGSEINQLVSIDLRAGERLIYENEIIRGSMSPGFFVNPI